MIFTLNDTHVDPWCDTGVADSAYQFCKGGHRGLARPLFLPLSHPFPIIDLLNHQFTTQFRFSKAYHMTQMHDLLLTAGATIWVRQIERHLLTVFDAWLQDINRRKMGVEGRSFRIVRMSRGKGSSWRLISIPILLLVSRRQTGTIQVNFVDLYGSRVYVYYGSLTGLEIHTGCVSRFRMLLL